MVNSSQVKLLFFSFIYSILSYPSMLAKVATDIASAFKSALSETIEQVFLTNRMNRKEALKILNLSDSFTSIELDKEFKKFYFVNSKENKGSPYIQRKIKNAYEYLIKE